jgi:hypothetical protein
VTAQASATREAPAQAELRPPAPRLPRQFAHNLAKASPSCWFPLFGLRKKKDKPFNTEFVLSPPPVEAKTINHHADPADNQPDEEYWSRLREEIEKANQNEDVGKQQNQICTENLWPSVPKPPCAQKLVLVD